MISLRDIKTFLIFTIVVTFIACNNKQSDSRNIQLLTDSSAYQNSSSSDSAKLNTSEAPKSEQVHNNSSKATEGQSNNAHDVSKSESATSTQSTEKKEGWSKAAQGAVIGGATGAVGGAIISKKKGMGAAVGAAVGAAGGYIIGREKDKKDGRVKKKE
jgi:hypothetical protein